MSNSDADPLDLGTGPTYRAVKAAFISRKIKGYVREPSPATVERWLIEFGALSKRDRLRFYHMSMETTS